MSFPLFINHNFGTGWTPSLLNYQMVSSNPLDSMNIFMNQAWTDSITKQMLYMTPQYNFNNFVPFGDTFNNNSYLCDPRYTLAQMAWGTPAWNNGFSSLWQGNFNWNGVSANNGSTPDSATSAEKRKYNKLLSFVKQLVKYEYLDSVSKDKLNDAINNNKGTTQEKYQALLDAYNTVDKDIVREFLTDKQSQVYDKESNGKQFIYSRLLGTGFEYTTNLDDKIGNYHNALQGVSGQDGNTNTKSTLIGDIKDGQYDILDVVSSWNTRYSQSTSSNKVKIVEYAVQRMAAINDDDQKQGIKDDINALVEAMISKANNVKLSLDADSQEKITQLVQELDNLKAQKAYNRMSAKFEELYLVTRLAAHEVLKNDLKAYYGEIDDEVFNNELFDEETYADLIAEGFTQEQINNAKVQLNGKVTRHSATRTTSTKTVDTKPAAEQVEYLMNQGALEQLNCKKDGTVTVYQETTMTGDSDGDGQADYKKLYYINEDGKLVEWTNTKLSNAGEFVIVNVGVAQTEGARTPSSIISAQNSAKNSDKSSKSKDGEQNQAFLCMRICDLLCGLTDEDDAKEIADLLNAINTDNIMELLHQYYDVKSPACEGIIEKIDDDCGEHVSMDIKYQLIQTVLDKALEQGYNTSSEYIALTDIVKYHKDYKNTEGVSNFNQTHSWSGLLRYTFNEKIDRYIKALYLKMSGQTK